MTLTERLAEMVRACFTGIWVRTDEADDALREIAALCRRENWRLASWDVASGLTACGAMAAEPVGPNDPLAAVRSLQPPAADEGAAVLALHNFHRFLGSPEVVQTLAQRLVAGKLQRTFVIVLAPVVQIPVELERLFVVVEHEPPGREQLAAIARGTATEAGELPEGAAFEALLDAAAGLTRLEAESAFGLALVRHGRLIPDVVWELKGQTLEQSGLLTLHRGGEDFSSLGGLTALKAFAKRALRPERPRDPSRRPRGVMLLSPPGCGKSQFAKALGREVGRPVLSLDVGTLMGSLLGQSEERTRRALRLVDEMAPCVAFVDEVEKAFSGVGDSGRSDGGVSSRMFSTFLTWLNDRESDVFVVCTANDVSRLPPEFSRAERFDAVFFLDLPGRAEKDAIWELYLGRFDLDPRQPRPDDARWTGAEIRACCRLAALLELPLAEAAQNVVPTAVSAAESVERLRAWASGRCLDAERGGVYRRDDAPASSPSSASPRRRVQRDPSSN